MYLLLLWGLWMSGSVGDNETLSPEQAESAAAKRLEAVRQAPNELRAFFRRMPKGADVQVSLLGGDYAENVLQLAAKDNLCLHPQTFAVTRGPCPAPTLPIHLLLRDQNRCQQAIGRLSFRDGQGTPEQRRGQIQKIMGRLEMLMVDRSAAIANLRRRALRENILMMEISIQDRKVRDQLTALALTLEREAGMLRWWKQLAPSLNRLVVKAERSLIRDHQESGCLAELAKDKGVMASFTYAVPRTLPPREFLAVASFAFSLAQHSPLVSGVTLSGNEAHINALMYFEQQLQILAFLHRQFPDVPRAYHAGALVPGNVPPEHLGTHIVETCRVAGVERLVHGSDIGFADNMYQQLNNLAAKQIPVVVTLSADEQLLGLTGPAHPLPMYLKHGVPVLLSADKPGLFRTDLSEQFYLAAVRYPQLTYRAFKQMARNSLTYSFLQGKSLWGTGKTDEAFIPFKQDAILTAEGKHFLDNNPKAAAQWRLEQQFFAFERGLVNPAQ